DLDMDEVIREAMAAATAPGVNVDEKLSARIEAAVARAQARAERAAAHVRERERRNQYASAAAEPAGPTVRETRTVDAFTGVSFGGAGRVFITVGPKASV